MDARTHDSDADDLLARMREDGLVEDPADILDAVEHPRWEATRRVHDWRNYVPPSMRARWASLPLLTRLCVYETAELAAIEEPVGGAMVTGRR